MSGANTSPAGRSDQMMSGANASPTRSASATARSLNEGRSDQPLSGAILKLDRRNFLKSSAMAAGGLVLGFYLPAPNEVEAQTAGQAGGAAVRMNAFIQ